MNSSTTEDQYNIDDVERQRIAVPHSIWFDVDFTSEDVRNLDYRST